jgi:hypothetical protein
MSVTPTTEQPEKKYDEPAITVWVPRMARSTVGIARADITPPVGIEGCVWGASTSTQSTGIHRSLSVTAVALVRESGSACFLVTTGLIGMSCYECERRIQSAVAGALTVEMDDVLLHSTHTHSAPRVCVHGPVTPGSELLPDFLDKVIEQVINACTAARDSAVEADVTWAYGRCDLAVNRDLPCGESDIVAFNPGAPADDTMAVGRITDSSGRILGVLVNYACHPTTLAWQNHLISPDFVGSAREIVEAQTKAPMVFLQGASGDLSPRMGFTGDTEIADRNGRILGYAVLSTLESLAEPASLLSFGRVVESGATLGEWLSAPAQPSTDLQTTRIDVPVSIKPLKPIEQLRAEWADIGTGASEERIRRAIRVRDGYKLDGSHRHPVWIWKWGDAVFVAQPGEAYSYLQTELRRRHPDLVIFVLNLTNGPGGIYLPTHRSYARHTYQSWQTLLAPGGLEHIVETADAAIRELAEPA